MTVKELIGLLKLLDNEDATIIVMGLDGCWSNIDLLSERGFYVYIKPEDDPVFSEY